MLDRHSGFIKIHKERERERERERGREYDASLYTCMLSYAVTDGIPFTSGKKKQIFAVAAVAAIAKSIFFLTTESKQ